MPKRTGPSTGILAVLAAVTGVMNARAEDVLLVTDAAADRVMAFSPVDGSVVNLNFITDPGVVNSVDIFNRPLHAIDSGRGTVLVSDQFANLVAEFTFDNQFVGIFANSGVVDTSVLSNVRGIGLLPGGDLLVTSGGGTIGVNARTVQRFNQAGARVDPFAFSRYGGIRGPFGILVLDDKVLVSDEGSDFIAQYTLQGKFTGLFARNLDFPQQMSRTPSGNILVAVFSGGVIAEFDANGTQVGQYDPGTLSGYRGIIELDNGNLLTTTGTGVHQVTRTGLVVTSPFLGSETRYIERVTLPAGLTLATLRSRAPSEQLPDFGEHQERAPDPEHERGEVIEVEPDATTGGDEGGAR